MKKAPVDKEKMQTALTTMTQDSMKSKLMGIGMLDGKPAPASRLVEIMADAPGRER